MPSEQIYLEPIAQIGPVLRMRAFGTFGLKIVSI